MIESHAIETTCARQEAAPSPRPTPLRRENVASQNASVRDGAVLVPNLPACGAMLLRSFSSSYHVLRVHLCVRPLYLRFSSNLFGDECAMMAVIKEPSVYFLSTVRYASFVSIYYCVFSSLLFTFLFTSCLDTPFKSLAPSTPWTTGASSVRVCVCLLYACTCFALSQMPLLNPSHSSNPLFLPVLKCTANFFCVVAKGEHYGCVRLPNAIASALGRASNARFDSIKSTRHSFELSTFRIAHTLSRER